MPSYGGDGWTMPKCAVHASQYTIHASDTASDPGATLPPPVAAQAHPNHQPDSTISPSFLTRAPRSSSSRRFSLPDDIRTPFLPYPHLVEPPGLDVDAVADAVGRLLRPLVPRERDGHLALGDQVRGHARVRVRAVVRVPFETRPIRYRQPSVRLGDFPCGCFSVGFRSFGAEAGPLGHPTGKNGFFVSSLMRKGKKRRKMGRDVRSVRPGEDVVEPPRPHLAFVVATRLLGHYLYRLWVGERKTPKTDYTRLCKRVWDRFLKSPKSSGGFV